MENEPTQMGFAAEAIPVPLFTELYGYGPFLGRRNRGVRDPLICRVATLHQGPIRLILIVSDLVTMDSEAAWRIRGELGRTLRIPGNRILVAGTHTHSGPTVSRGIGWGELDPVFQQGWIEVAVRTASRAMADETPVTATAGRVALSAMQGCNRVFKNGPTDPDIRWVRFTSPDGSTKLLLHNHGMHAVVFGPKMLRVSADWPGEANRLIVETGLAQNALFLQGAAGDVNTEPCCQDEEQGEPILRRIGASYTKDLQRGLEIGGTPLSLMPLDAALETVAMPCDPVTATELRDMAARLCQLGAAPFMINRMEEMALYLEAGGSAKTALDFQVLRVGDLFIHAVPGEPFVEVGCQLMASSPGRMVLVAEVANDNGRYFPTPEVFSMNPEIVVPSSRSGYGYYESRFAGFGRYRANYSKNVGPFVTERLLRMAQGLCQQREDPAGYQRKE